jgi:hypothetical protein
VVLVVLELEVGLELHVELELVDDPGTVVEVVLVLVVELVELGELVEPVELEEVVLDDVVDGSVVVVVVWQVGIPDRTRLPPFTLSAPDCRVRPPGVTTL